MPPERIADLGEFPLLARLRRRLGSAYLGDDAAVLPGTGDRAVLATVDAQVDGIHFLRDLMTPEQVGRRALAVNVSDIAAMGGRPTFALASLLLPAALEVSWLERMYDGLLAEAGRWGLDLAGGNISSTPGPLVIDVTVLGEVEPARVLRRCGARPGDLLFVTGSLGRAAAGLRLLRGGTRAGPLVEAYCTPTPRVREGLALAATGRVRAALDISDGLGSDAHRMAEESGVGAVVDAARLPIAGAVREAAERLGEDPLSLALFGGEDYELLLAAAPADAEALTAALVPTGTPLTAIGAVRPAAAGVSVRMPDGSERPLAGGWDHFAPRGMP
ncbi:MAG: thiamine-phosphate kinase [Armatimonadota bacterium]|nr:thiamine-phosphate kinase [Armatimonadota bacterium]MDR7532717.1 thiamine-phosphate kinase [Armatimonadota bacterium]MDR7535337.1 thiamine-phosphate kinase [Armatimonadota bacterium]